MAIEGDGGTFSVEVSKSGDWGVPKTRSIQTPHQATEDPTCVD